MGSLLSAVGALLSASGTFGGGAGAANLCVRALCGHLAQKSDRCKLLSIAMFNFQEIDHFTVVGLVP